MRSLLAFWLGGASSAPRQPAFRGVLGFWLGGVSSGEEIVEPEDPGSAINFQGRTGGGRPGHRFKRFERLHEAIPVADVQLDAPELDAVEEPETAPRTAPELAPQISARDLESVYTREFLVRLDLLREESESVRLEQAAAIAREAFARARLARDARVRADEDELAIAMLALMMADD